MTTETPIGSNCYDRFRAKHRLDCEAMRRYTQRTFGTSLRSEKCDRCAGWHLTFAERLTRRQRQVLYFSAIGLHAHEMMGVVGSASVNSVNKLKSKLASRLGATSLTHLIAVAVQIGVIDLFSIEGDPNNGRHPGEHLFNQANFRAGLSGSAQGFAGT